jgi:polar amino acid transport system substrate-binding protein
MRRGWFSALALVVVLAIVATACGGDDDDGGPAATGGQTGESPAEEDLLARIQEEGVIRVSTDPAYPPQSELNDETGEFEGFDIDVAEEVASRLGVVVEWKTPSWNAITSGGWSDRWDMSVGSMTVTVERAEVVHFTPAYYFTPASAAVHEENTTFTDVATDLDGTTIGVCGSCSYDFYLQKNLHIQIPGYEFDYVIDDADIQTYDTDTTAIRDLSLGDGVRLDAAISALPTLEQAIKDGEPIKILGDPLFYEPLAVAFDKQAPVDPTGLVDEVSRIIEEMHEDGTLTELSMKWYGEDLTKSTV